MRRHPHVSRVDSRLLPSVSPRLTALRLTPRLLPVPLQNCPPPPRDARGPRRAPPPPPGAAAAAPALPPPPRRLPRAAAPRLAPVLTPPAEEAAQAWGRQGLRRSGGGGQQLRSGQVLREDPRRRPRDIGGNGPHWEASERFCNGH